MSSYFSFPARRASSCPIQRLPTLYSSMDYLEKAARVLDIEIFELKRLRERLGENFSRAVELIKETVDARGKVVVLGVGKSEHVGAKIAATMTSTGSPAVVLDSSNALHGDLGMIADGDVVLALGDALAMVLLEARGFNKEDFAKFHPAGVIGRSLLMRVHQIMRPAEGMAIVSSDAPIRDVLKAMTSVRAGAAVVADEDRRLLGIFTHGDFVRHFQSDSKIGERLVADLMTLNPVTVHKDKLAVEVLNLLERHRIDDLVVVDDNNMPVGIVDSQDLTRLKLL